MEPLTFISVFVIGFIASMINAVAGTASGVFALPVLMLMGLPPHLAIATFKFGCIGGTSAQIYRFNKAKVIAKKYLPTLLVFAVIGSALGASVLVRISSELLSKIIAIAVLISIPFILLGRTGLERRAKAKKSIVFGYAWFFLLFIYDGIIGLLGGAFAAILFMYYFGLTMIESNATKQVVFLVTLIVTVAILYISGYVNVFYGIAMLLGMIAGGYLGAHIVVKKGSNKLVRYAFVAAVIVSAIKLLFF